MQGRRSKGWPWGWSGAPCTGWAAGVGLCQVPVKRAEGEDEQQAAQQELEEDASCTL